MLKLLLRPTQLWNLPSYPPPLSVSVANPQAQLSAISSLQVPTIWDNGQASVFPCSWFHNWPGWSFLAKIIFGWFKLILIMLAWRFVLTTQHWILLLFAVMKTHWRFSPLWLTKIPVSLKVLLVILQFPSPHVYLPPCPHPPSPGNVLPCTMVSM